MADQDELLVQAAGYAIAAGYQGAGANASFTQWLPLAHMQNFTSLQIANYVLMYWQFEYMLHYWNVVMGILNIVFAVFGTFGYAAEIVVLAQPDFKGASFVYHKSIVAVEIFTMALLMSHGILNFGGPPCKVYLTYEWDQGISYSLSNLTTCIADLIAIFMTLERIIALWVTQFFFYVNRPPVALAAVALSIIIGSLAYIPDTLGRSPSWDPVNLVYIYVSSAFAQSVIGLGFSKYKTLMMIVKAFVLISASFIVVAGVIRRAKRLAKLDSSTLEDDAKRARQVTILSLICVVPVTFHNLIYIILNGGPSFGYTLYSIGTTAIKTMPYNVAVSQLTVSAYIYWIFVGIEYLLLFFAHSMHFYVYYSFSKMFRDVARRTLVKPIKRKLGIKDNVVQSVAMQSVVSHVGSRRGTAATVVTGHV